MIYREQSIQQQGVSTSHPPILGMEDVSRFRPVRGPFQLMKGVGENIDGVHVDLQVIQMLRDDGRRKVYLERPRELTIYLRGIDRNHQGDVYRRIPGRSTGANHSDGAEYVGKGLFEVHGWRSLEAGLDASADSARTGSGALGQRLVNEKAR